jgi:glycerol-3-phosphate acyltransferase PlsY
MDIVLYSNLFFYILAYAVGGIPFGLLLAKKFAQVDIKSSGSKSIGATNVLRVVKEKNPSLAKKLGAATLILDALKGFIVLLWASSMGIDQGGLWAVAVLSVIGHCYSPYLVFEGGKGVATGVGVLAFMLPLETAIALFVWGFSAKVLKISSVSSLLGLISILISANIFSSGLGVESNVPLYMIAFIIFYKHIPNIVRLVKKEEAKVV